MKKNTLKSISDLKKKDLKGKVVVLRADFNVPIQSGKVTNSYRIKQALPTLRFLSKNGAKTIILSHMSKEESSLRPVANYLKDFLQIGFTPNLPSLGQLSKMQEGNIILIDNIRKQKGEEKNSKALAKDIASIGDIYVNDAFSASHREHASIVGIPQYLPAYAGLLFMKEFEHLSKVITPKKPFVLILGGAKFETKIPLVERYVKNADNIFIVGAIAHQFFKRLGFNIGKSLVDKDSKIVGQLLKNKKIRLPVDVIVKTTSGNLVKKPEDVSTGDIIFDAGPETVKQIGDAVKKAKMILWNGPLGNFEAGYDEGTKGVAKKIATASGYSVVGGGDTIASIEELSLNNKFGFVSTAGGAMLDFLSTGTLPGIEALNK